MSKDLAKTQVMSTGLGVVDAEAILRDVGRSLRRVDSTSSNDPPGLRCIWHQGKMRTEMLTWEKRDEAKKIDRQELSFFGKMVEYTAAQGVRTGVIAESTLTDAGPRMPKSELFMATREPDLMMLDAASRILRECSKRDFYTQHLLQLINDLLRSLEKKNVRTQVNGLDFFRTIEQAVAAEKAQAKQSKKLTTVLAIGIVAVATVVAIAVFYLIWKH